MFTSIVTFADLGKRKNLKTQDILPLIRVFRERRLLSQIICRINRNFDFPDTVSAIPEIVHWIFTGIQQLFPPFSARKTEEKLFDTIASQVLTKKAKVVLFHPARFKRTMTFAKKNKSIIIGLGTTAHPNFNLVLYKQECKKFGIILESASDISWEYHITNKFDYIIAFSEYVKKTYIKNGYSAEQIFVAQSDMDVNEFKPQNKSRDKRFRVLYVAHTSLLKGLHYLLDAWQSLDIQHAELLIVGDCGDIPFELEKKYENTIKTNPTIKWIGYTKNIKKYYNEASVFVLPSLTEGNPRVVMEAMACGIPVITTENAKSIVEDGKSGFVVPIRDVNAIKEKIEFLYNNRNIGQKMGKEARRAIENKKSFGEAVFKIYNEILKREGITK